MPTIAPPPGPRGRWLTGNLGEFRRDMLGFFTRCAREYGDVAAFRLGPRRIWLLSRPEDIDYVLTTANRNFIKSYVLRLLEPVLGQGLVTSNGDFWLRQRRLAQPAFHRTRIAAYGTATVDLAGRFVADWSDGETRDLHAEMMRLTLAIVSKTLFDADTTGDARDVADASEVVLRNFNDRWESVLPLPVAVPTPGNLRLRRAVRQLDAVIYRLIARRRATGADHGDFLSMLLRARDTDGSGMTDQQVRDEAMTLYLAGYETTANALAWTWYLLASHPEVEERLLAELQGVVGERPPSPDDLPQLRFTEAVVTESMRLYPPAHVIGREAIEACEIGGYPVPVGATLLMSQWVVHRDPRYFDNAEKFAPERWLDGLAKRLPKCAYFPFGAGPRVCIGNTFAMMEVMLIIASLVPRFRFSLVPDRPVVPRPSVTLRPAQGIWAVVHRRGAS